jgi:hypothetical protein
MITLTLTTPVIILGIVSALLLAWIISCDGMPGYLGSDRSWAIMASIVLWLIAFLMVGGIWWW